MLCHLISIGTKDTMAHQHYKSIQQTTASFTPARYLYSTSAYAAQHTTCHLSATDCINPTTTAVCIALCAHYCTYWLIFCVLLYMLIILCVQYAHDLYHSKVGEKLGTVMLLDQANR